MIVEDDAILRDTLAGMIAAAEGLALAGAWSSAEEAASALPRLPADVMLLDIGLPGISGADAVATFRKDFPAMSILMLTVFSDRPKVFTSICSGASGYLLKSTPSEELFEAIRAAHAGGSPLSPEIARQIVELFQKMGAPEPSEASLTQSEQRLLWLLSKGHSYAASAREMHISINTVRNYVRSIYDKLHVQSKSAAVSAALRKGLLSC